MSGLFDTPVIPGLRIAQELIDPAEEQALIERIDASGLKPFQFGQFEGRRLTRSFGCHYDFTSRRIVEAEPIPEWLEGLRRRAADVAEVDASRLAHALLIRYDPGAGIGWHKDRTAFDRVVGISLGAPVELALRRRRAGKGFDRARLPLTPRSAYLLSDEVRHEWEHGIAAHPALRYSVTFRTLARDPAHAAH